MHNLIFGLLTAESKIFTSLEISPSENTDLPVHIKFMRSSGMLHSALIELRFRFKNRQKKVKLEERVLIKASLQLRVFISVTSLSKLLDSLDSYDLQ